MLLLMPACWFFPMLHESNPARTRTGTAIITTINTYVACFWGMLSFEVIFPFLHFGNELFAVQRYRCTLQFGLASAACQLHVDCSCLCTASPTFSSSQHSYRTVLHCTQPLFLVHLSIVSWYTLLLVQSTIVAVVAYLYSWVQHCPFLGGAPSGSLC